jgi:hypothetical protein
MRSAAVVVLLFLSMPLFAQDDTRPWERLGLSLTEWKLIQDNNMPMSKVESLLKDGIGISEYFRKPWEPLGMTESKWIAKRRLGLTNYDIEQEVHKTANDSSMQPTSPEENTFEQFDRSQETRETFGSFFLPGVIQCKRGHKGRGGVMIGLAIGSIGGTVAWSVAQKQFIPVPLLAICIPDMAWSLIDHKVYLRKKTR